VYVLKGEHTRDEFLGIASGPQIAESVSSMVKVKDWVRRENLVTCGSRGSINSAQTDLVTVLSVGAHDRAGAVVNGMLGASQNIPYFRYSEPFEVEAGKSYTVLMTDEDPDADYKIMFTLDPAASSVRQNGSVRYFDIRTEPFGLLIPDVSARSASTSIRRRIALSIITSSMSMCWRVCSRRRSSWQLLKLEIAWTMRLLAFQS
jgi:hypothetical protein